MQGLDLRRKITKHIRRKPYKKKNHAVTDWMQKLFKIWLIVIIALAVIASFIIGVESAFFGFVLIPTILIASFILILGFGSSLKKK